MNVNIKSKPKKLNILTQILTKQMFLKTTGNLFIAKILIQDKLMIMGLTICLITIMKLEL